MSLPIFNFTKIESTNDFARILITEHKINKGIVTADEQTKGRGRYGNQWSSPKGNLYFTIFFPILRSNLKKIQFLVQLQIRNILKKYRIKNLSLKWPNDLYINNKKVCGILQESIVFKKFFLIIGIGINIQSSPKIKKYQTTYLNKEAKKKINLNELAEKLKSAFISNIINKKHSFKNILKEWNKYAFNKNKFINFKIKNKIYRGIFKGINNNGALILEHNNRKDYFSHGSLI
jgi:BirA family biotin operon repressor/biotin-[acetyl-CoA-carboxylase] ligase